MSNDSQSLLDRLIGKVPVPAFIMSIAQGVGKIPGLKFLWSVKTKIIMIVMCAGIVWWCDSMYINDAYRRSIGGPGDAGESTLYKIESKILDAKFRIRGPVEPTGKVGILAADEQTLNKFGDWPISRKFYGPTLRNLKKLGVKVVGFDSFYVETEDTKLEDVIPIIESAKSTLKSGGKRGARQAVSELNGLELFLNRSAGDEDFAKAVGEWENVILGYASLKSETEVKEQIGNDPAEYFKDLDTISISETFAELPAKIELDDIQNLVKVYGFKSNYESLNSAGSHFGFFDNDADGDSINRWVTVVQRYQDKVMPALSLKAAALALDYNITVAELNKLGVMKVVIFNEETEENKVLETDPYFIGRMLINHRGKGRTIQHFSMQDAYYNTFTSEERKKLKGMTLLFGGTATGTQDLRPNPFDAAIDGVENHAALVDNIIADDYLVRKAQVAKFKLFGKEIVLLENELLVLLGLIFAPFVIWASSLVSGGAMITFIGGLIYYDWNYSFLGDHQWHYIGLPCFQLFVMFFTCNFFRYVVEEAEKRAVKGAFEHYLSPDVIKQVLDDPAAMSLGGTRKDITVFFSDVRSFTAISEGLSPEKLTQFMNLYFEPMTSIVLDSKGTLDKYIGDAIMAFWGAPIAMEDHAAVASRASVDMMFALDKLQHDLPAMGFPKPDIGIGLNSGPASVGNMGSAARFSYTALGDSVNLGARLEGVTKEYKVKILMSEFTAGKLNRDQFYYRDMDLIRVKGKEEAVRIFELMRPDYCGTEDQVKNLIGEFELARLAYLEQNWSKAEKHFVECLNIHPEDGPSKIYLELLQHMKVNPPGEQWDGVKTMTHK